VRWVSEIDQIPGARGKSIPDFIPYFVHCCARVHPRFPAPTRLRILATSSLASVVMIAKVRIHLLEVGSF
jgi:hypothetical protein